ncbi:MAG: nuclear transport factor 2 family protein [Myxococcales bacterium]|nr:nuclear transport factor 2 family protein [Myxococcales bacterium]
MEQKVMANDAEAVDAATRRFYAAIEDMVSGRGLATMEQAWHHTDRVTSKHPSGEWAQGWDEVWATWQVFASFGRSDRGGGKLLSTQAHVYGDVAYSTSVFQAAPSWGGEVLMCTNVLLRIDGEWKVIHHHADPAPKMAAALEQMLHE